MTTEDIPAAAWSDFAKMVEAFDAKGISFVSVTQQFNTTTSMGRLTLNVLLSFAQFEREVTGERIRDKIAASKKKGMWMGGLVPLGYDLKDRKLVPSPKEAELVSKIFSLYLEPGCVRKLAQRLDREEIRSKVWITRTGTRLGGVAFARWRPLRPATESALSRRDPPPRPMVSRRTQGDRSWIALGSGPGSAQP
ncbi:MAG: recombinase family protein [Terriglobales bacterium]